MAKIKFDDKLVVERFPGQSDWIEPLFRIINDFFAQVGGALKGRLTFLDNFLGREKEFDFTYQSDSLSLPQKFTWDLIGAPRSLQVVSATEDGDPVALVHAWEYTSNSLVQLTKIYRVTTAPAIAALNVGSRYKIRVRVTP